MASFPNLYNENIAKGELPRLDWSMKRPAVSIHSISTTLNIALIAFSSGLFLEAVGSYFYP